MESPQTGDKRKLDIDEDQKQPQSKRPASNPKPLDDRPQLLMTAGSYHTYHGFDDNIHIRVVSSSGIVITTRACLGTNSSYLCSLFRIHGEEHNKPMTELIIDAPIPLRAFYTVMASITGHDEAYMFTANSVEVSADEYINLCEWCLRWQVPEAMENIHVEEDKLLTASGQCTPALCTLFSDPYYACLSPSFLCGIRNLVTKYTECTIERASYVMCRKNTLSTRCQLVLFPWQTYLPASAPFRFIQYICSVISRMDSPRIDKLFRLLEKKWEDYQRKLARESISKEEEEEENGLDEFVPPVVMEH